LSSKSINWTFDLCSPHKSLKENRNQNSIYQTPNIISYLLTQTQAKPNSSPNLLLTKMNINIISICIYFKRKLWPLLERYLYT